MNITIEITRTILPYIVGVICWDLSTGVSSDTMKAILELVPTNESTQRMTAGHHLEPTSLLVSLSILPECPCDECWLLGRVLSALLGGLSWAILQLKKKRYMMKGLHTSKYKNKLKINILLTKSVCKTHLFGRLISHNTWFETALLGLVLML